MAQNNQKAYTVGQVNHYLAAMFANDYLLNRIYVRGEVSNCKYHHSGHLYFSLKDESGKLDCVMFAGNVKNLSFKLKEGQKVLVLGSVKIYERGGSYQLYATEIQLDGEGLLYKKFLELKRELEEMGMFDPSYKQSIPKYVRRVGVVTAPTGAAIQDIINITKRRNPFVQLILYPAQVQGIGAAESIARGIQVLDEYDTDVLIVGRGGGSIEDLWAFNEEIVARAIFECRTPVISAVGHETDTTIADYVADLRAPTPSAGAELAVRDIRLTLQEIEDYRTRLATAVESHVEEASKRAENLELKLRSLSPKNKYHEKRQQLLFMEERMEQLFMYTLEQAKLRLSNYSGQLPREMTLKINDRRQRLSVLAGSLDGRSPLKRLEQGFSYTEDAKGRALTDVDAVETGDLLTIHVRNGDVKATVTEKIRRER